MARRKPETMIEAADIRQPETVASAWRAHGTAAIRQQQLVPHHGQQNTNMKYKKKPVVIEAITFDELVAHGKANTTNIGNGMPWSFDYAGQPITHENDDCYLIPTIKGTMKMTRGDMLITGVKGEIYPCKCDIFAATYDAVSE